MDRQQHDAERRQEADAILKRLREETDVQVGGTTQRMLTDVRGHFAAADADPADRVEVLGTRIGRLLGLAGFVVLLVIFVRTYLVPA